MIIERRNVACRLIMKATGKGSLAGYFVHLDARSTHMLVRRKHTSLSTVKIHGLAVIHLAK